MPAYLPVIYIINPDNLIIQINDAWDKFAAENQGDAIPKVAVLGHSVLEFVSGKVTQRYWQNLLERARHSTAPLRVNYRCDAPNLKRWMQMELRLLDNGDLRISHVQRYAQHRKNAVFFVRALQRGKQGYIRCSMCNRVKSAERWVEPEEIGVATATTHTLQVTYGLCESCAQFDGLSMETSEQHHD